MRSAEVLHLRSKSTSVTCDYGRSSRLQILIICKPQTEVQISGSLLCIYSEGKLRANSSVPLSITIRLPVTLLGAGETLTQFSPCRLQLYTRLAPTSSLRPVRRKT